MKRIYLLFLISLFQITASASSVESLLDKGWKELVKDNDVKAFQCFNLAYQQALEEKDTANTALSLLNMGICTYGVSYNEGLQYCFRAMDLYKHLENSNPLKALEGRCRCLQLISTIYGLQGRYRESIDLSRQAMSGFPSENDSTGYLGLIYNSLGSAYKNLGFSDSSEYFHRLALQERLLTKNYTYLPGSYMSVAEIEMKHGNKEQSRIYYDRAMYLSDSTGNRQSQVMSLIGLGKWSVTFEKNNNAAEEYFLKGLNIAAELSDKMFYSRVLGQLILLKKQQGDFMQALQYEQQLSSLKDSLNNWEKQKIQKNLEVQFNVSEKDRKLKLAQQEKNITLLTNYLLWGSLAALIIIAIGIILFLRRINKRDKLLLQTKEALVFAVEEQKKLKEQQMQNELEFKESQLSAMTFQMMQKNELMHELKEKLEQDKNISGDNSLNRIIHKGMNQDKEWSDFNAYFESLNKNFYARLKQAYPDISPNDLKICALIKLNLSIKEMAAILNISPDSVKTARYRLRKKLQLNTEDNLTNFILSL